MFTRSKNSSNWSRRVNRTISDTPNPASSPWLFPAISAVVALIVIFVLTDIFFVDVMIGLLIDGAILLAYLLSACGWGWWVVGKAPVRAVTATAIGLGIMGLLTLGLGLGGFFNIYSAIGIVVVGVLLAQRILRDWAKVSRPDTGTNAWLIPFSILLALALVGASICPGFMWKPLDPHPYDAISYHLQVPREWFDAGQIIPLKHNAFSFFPMGMEMHYFAAMTLKGSPWAGMYLCQMLTLAHGVLTIVAVGQIAMALGATSMRAWSAALMVACVPWVFQLSVVAYVETGVMLYTTLAVGWVCFAMQVPRGKSFVIIGLLAGLACGMKYTAFPMTGILIVLIAGVHQTIKGRFPNAVLVGCVILLTTSPWLFRNVAWTGNPVFPLATGVFGQGHFSDAQVDRYRIAHQPPAREASVGSRLSNGFSRTIADRQFAFLMLPIGLGAIGWLCVRRDRNGIVIGVMVLGMIGIWLSATHIMPRFITPIVPLLGIAIALLPLPGYVVLSVGVLQAGLGLTLIGGWLGPWIQTGRQGVFRLENVSILETDETRAARISGDKVALIGDAQAFFYVMPSDQLIYRSVFDVNIPDGTTAVDGWLGESVESLRARGVWVVINTSELNRLAGSYRHIPMPVAPYDRVLPTPTVLPPTGR
jgi:hypothetical protein